MKHFEDMFCVVALTSWLNLMLGNFLTHFITLHYNLLPCCLWYSPCAVTKEIKIPGGDKIQYVCRQQACAHLFTMECTNQMFYLYLGWHKSLANKSSSAILRLNSTNKQRWKETILKETSTFTCHINHPSVWCTLTEWKWNWSVTLVSNKSPEHLWRYSIKGEFVRRKQNLPV